MNLRIRKRFIHLSALWLATLFVLTANGKQLLLIQGASGKEEYAERFASGIREWERLSAEAGLSPTVVRSEREGEEPVDRILSWIHENKDAPEVWIVYIGHGTYSTAGAKLNLEGADLSATELAAALSDFRGALVFVHGGSASAPFLPLLSAENRVVITATRSGHEQNYARFGELFAAKMRTESSDIDLDGKVSLLEAFLSATRAVEAFYFEAGRLTSEHALIDDNGDGKGSPASRFDGLRPIDVEGSASKTDGLLAKRVSFVPGKGERLLSMQEQERRDELEQELEGLYLRKADLGESRYFEELEKILTQLAELYLGSDPEQS